jgi:hypothetical protein
MIVIPIPAQFPEGMLIKRRTIANIIPKLPKIPFELIAILIFIVFYPAIIKATEIPVYIF